MTVKNLTRQLQTGLTLIEDLTDPRPAFKEWKEYKLDEDKHVRPFRFERRNFRSPFKIATVKEGQIPALPRGTWEVTVELTPGGGAWCNLSESRLPDPTRWGFIARCGS